MASYYGYAERSAEDQINWSAIGKGMTDMLKEEQDRRDTLKAEIDKASVEFGEVLSSAPQGTHRGMSEYSLDFASDAQNNNLLQLRLLKSGKLKLKDYLVNRENLKQGAGDVFGIMKEYQEKFGEYVARSKSSIGEDGKSIPPQSGFYEAFMLEEVEGFGNLSSTKPYINPTTGKVSIGRRVLQDPSKEYDSVTNPYTARMSDNPSDFRTTQELRFAMSSKTDRFDTAGAIDGIIESFAKEYQVLTKKGSSSTIITDARDMPKFDEVLKTRINAAFNANPMDALSALGDFIVMGPNGERIGLTRDPDDVNDHTILLVANPSQPEGGSPVPDFDSDSGKKILDYMTKKVSESVTAGINRKIQYQRALQPPTPATRPSGDGKVEIEKKADELYRIEREKLISQLDALNAGSPIDGFRKLREWGGLFNVPIKKGSINVGTDDDPKIEERIMVGSGNNMEILDASTSFEDILFVAESQVTGTNINNAYRKRGDAATNFNKTTSKGESGELD
tara:strand:+ start:237 stop:1757 length:1521 start_codon:yes stop_codon:yes gene_type:complete